MHGAAARALRSRPHAVVRGRRRLAPRGQAAPALPRARGRARPRTTSGRARRRRAPLAVLPAGPPPRSSTPPARVLAPDEPAGARRRPRRRHLRLHRRRPGRAAVRRRARAPRRRPRTSGSAARARGCWRCRSPRSPACRCSAAASLAGEPPTVLAPRRDRSAAAVARMPAAGRRYTVARAHPAAPVPRRRARRAARLRRRSWSAARPPTRRCSPAPASAGVAGGHHLRHDRDRRRLRLRRPAARRRRRPGRPTAACELSGPTLALGYRLDPAATAEALRRRLVPHPRRRLAADDGRLTVTGRLDDVVITGGVNVAPAAVEAALREHPDVADAVVFGRPDDEWGQRVVAAVVPTRGRRARPRRAARLGRRPARRPGGPAAAAPARPRSRSCTPASPTARGRADAVRH